MFRLLPGNVGGPFSACLVYWSSEREHGLSGTPAGHRAAQTQINLLEKVKRGQENLGEQKANSAAAVCSRGNWGSDGASVLASVKLKEPWLTESLLRGEGSRAGELSCNHALQKGRSPVRWRTEEVYVGSG